MSLIEALQTLPDHRRGAGRRYPLWVFLLLVILGTMSGYRGLARFMQRHQAHLAERLGLPRAELPSYSTIRRLLMELDFNAVAACYSPISTNSSPQNHRRQLWCSGASCCVGIGTMRSVSALTG